MNLFPFIISFLSGISTLIGALLIFLKNKNKEKIITISLSFAAGSMICVSFFDLIPNAFKLIFNSLNIFPKILITMIFIVIGIILSMLIDKYIPDNNKNNSLYKIGIISMIAIILHNIPEGIATFLTTTNNIKLGIKLSISIALHNIPEGISIAIPIYYATNNRKKALFYAFISGISEFIGSIIAFLFLKPFINNNIIASLYSIIAGIMIHISIYELLPEAYKNSNIIKILKYFLIGFIIMLISHLII